jgi:hypothetical protein
MDVNILPALTTMFGTASDLIIAFMTINRYHLIKSALLLFYIPMPV